VIFALQLQLGTDHGDSRLRIFDADCWARGSSTSAQGTVQIGQIPLAPDVPACSGLVADTHVSVCKVARQSTLEGRPAVDTFEQRTPATEYDLRAAKIAAARRTVTPRHSIYAGMSRTTSVNLSELIS
jgi:hypothetical protein